MSKGIRVQNSSETTMNASKALVINSPCIGLNGALKVDTIVANHIQSEGYSTGSHGSDYKGAGHNLADGTGTSGNNVPDRGDGGGNNRHCAAWEQLMAATELICDMLACNCSKTGCPDTTAQVRSLIAQAKMLRNRGE